MAAIKELERELKRELERDWSNEKWGMVKTNIRTGFLIRESGLANHFQACELNLYNTCVSVAGGALSRRTPSRSLRPEAPSISTVCLNVAQKAEYPGLHTRSAVALYWRASSECRTSACGGAAGYRLHTPVPPRVNENPRSGCSMWMRAVSKPRHWPCI